MPLLSNMFQYVRTIVSCNNRLLLFNCSLLYSVLMTEHVSGLLLCEKRTIIAVPIQFLICVKVDSFTGKNGSYPFCSLMLLFGSHCRSISQCYKYRYISIKASYKCRMGNMNSRILKFSGTFTFVDLNRYSYYGKLKVMNALLFGLIVCMHFIQHRSGVEGTYRHMLIISPTALIFHIIKKISELSPNILKLYIFFNLLHQFWFL